MSSRRDPGNERQHLPGTQSTPAALPALRPSDPAVQIVESAYQIVTMIGANPRAIRPILAQRRLTKEQVLEAAATVAERAAAALSGLDAETEQRGQRTYLTGLQDRAAKVAEIYDAL